MSRAYDIECAIAALERAALHAKAARMDAHFTSEITHLVDTARANANANASADGNGNANGNENAPHGPATRPCADDTEDPCYYRAPNHGCTRTAHDGPCVHAERIAKRKAKNTTTATTTTTTTKTTKTTTTTTKTTNEKGETQC